MPEKYKKKSYKRYSFGHSPMTSFRKLSGYFNYIISDSIFQSFENNFAAIGHFYSIIGSGFYLSPKRSAYTPRQDNTKTAGDFI
ncbi:MAG: hypothetical protein K2N71_10620, partial [Oscillospiraceae bacterium]|nr:hypothetical protein [Oscillospiraceae bacterium]